MSTSAGDIPRARRVYPHARQQPTRWNDNDAFGHMNNAVHYQFFDTAVNLQLRDWGSAQSPQDSFRFIVAETGCRYFSELRYPGVITLGLRVAHLGRSSVRYELGLFAEGSDQAAATGFLVHVHVAKDTNRPSPIPEDLRVAMTASMAANTPA